MNTVIVTTIFFSYFVTIVSTHIRKLNSTKKKQNKTQQIWQKY